MWEAPAIEATGEALKDGQCVDFRLFGTVLNPVGDESGCFEVVALE
jgi:hypothetical protein